MGWKVNAYRQVCAYKNMNKRTTPIVIIILLVAIIVVGLFIWNFHSSDISSNPADWSMFASYFNGILTPILTFINIMVLLGVGQSIRDISKENRRHKKRLQTYNNSNYGDLKIGINPEATVEDNLKEMECHLARIEELFVEFKKSDERCENDFQELVERLGVSKSTNKSLSNIAYYENPFFNRMWEMHNIAVPNVISYAQTSFLQLKVNVYNLMLAQEPDNETIHAKLVSAQKELEDYHRDSMLAD